MWEIFEFQHLCSKPSYKNWFPEFALDPKRKKKIDKDTKFLNELCKIQIVLGEKITWRFLFKKYKKIYQLTTK